MVNNIPLFGIADKVESAIALIREHEPPEGYFVCFSGGKDSCVTYDLVKRAGVKHDVHYNVTTLEPPQLIEFINANFSDIEFHYPPKDIWQLMRYHMFPPTRLIRYCTTELKMTNGQGRVKISGVRRLESSRRRNLEAWMASTDGARFLNPIINWSADDVWEYIHSRNIPYCKLYDAGFTRLGCVLCPCQGRAETQLHLQTFPDIAAKFKETFDWIVEERKRRERLGKVYKPPGFKTGEELWDWWIKR